MLVGHGVYLVGPQPSIVDVCLVISGCSVGQWRLFVWFTVLIELVHGGCLFDQQWLFGWSMVIVYLVHSGSLVGPWWLFIWSTVGF